MTTGLSADLEKCRSFAWRSDDREASHKDELFPGDSDAPHSEDEVRVNSIVDSLNFMDCRAIFDKIRLSKREHAIRVVEQYLGICSN